MKSFICDTFLDTAILNLSSYRPPYNEKIHKLPIHFKDAYQNVLNVQKQAGRLEARNAEFLHIITTRFYEIGGHVVLPILLIKKENNYYCEDDPDYIWWYRDYEKYNDYGMYRDLETIFYTHVLPDGRLMEFVFNNDESQNHWENIYTHITSVREAIELDDKLNHSLIKKQVDNTIQRNKI